MLYIVCILLGFSGGIVVASILASNGPEQNQELGE